MYFAVAGIEVSPLVPPLAAFCVSFFASMGGISGAFLLLPFQMSFLGYTAPSVSATNQFYNVVAIPSGVYRYIKEKRMVWPLTLAVAVGTLPGVFIGAYVRVAWLPDPKPFKLFAACVLLYIGAKLVGDLLKKRQGKVQPRGIVTSGAGGEFTVTLEESSVRRIAYTFQGELHECPTSGVFALAFIVGVIGGAYGIGGGAIIAPFFVSWFRLPVHTISGATLMGTFLTSIAGVAFYSLIAPYYPEQSVSPDWGLGLLFGLGGAAGMYLGARCQKYVPATVIKWALGAVIIGTALKYAVDYFT
ncbi:MAG: sulfite exporter TauE/SafE family protein [Desulfovibrio sp.]|jgi:uncharacterized membrane protein YfcA|nr:sulfite exporter TauE/SafE family protein [Desulfovibrio sp.]